MIKKTYLFPQFFIHKQAFCDDCNIPLTDTGVQLLSNPPLQVMKCSKCNKEYNIKVSDLLGEWKWRVL